MTVNWFSSNATRPGCLLQSYSNIAKIKAFSVSNQRKSYVCYNVLQAHRSLVAVLISRKGAKAQSILVETTDVHGRTRIGKASHPFESVCICGFFFALALRLGAFA
ncbi:MAG: hypothetical protein AAF711_05625 [Planctomycetota bacterium]